MPIQNDKQSTQTLAEFRAIADWWNDASEDGATYSVIAHRNKIVQDFASQYCAKSSVLDVGCGSGQLVIKLAQMGMTSHGIDVSPEMISHCKNNLEGSSVNAEFYLDSFFNHKFDSNLYSLISALGFIEYISQMEFQEFLSRVSRLLEPNGKLVIGSRNRLFNIVCLNQFTSVELELENIENLVKQAIICQTSTSQEAAISSLAVLGSTEVQPQTHPKTGIQVDTRYQYSPAELCMRLANVGLIPKALIPINYHGIPTSLIDIHRSEYESLALSMSRSKTYDQRLLPYCSSFLVAAEKT
jgi:2-polyprenyl-3-methyl-5-hydroxy-6-metoxy-1,4-benzoquinol methylase